MPKHGYAIVNTSRWESQSIAEWLSYHRSIGFEHVYIYCNDDEPDEMYAAILPFLTGSDPFVTFHHSPFQGQQISLYMHFLEHHRHECEWFMFVDADEFVALKQHRDLDAFMTTRRHSDCIYFNWLWFGPQEFEVRPQGSVLLQYCQREDVQVQMNYFTKGLTRSSSVDLRLLAASGSQIFHHHWPSPVAARMRSENVLGDEMRDYFKDFPRSAEACLASVEMRRRIIDVACINHYVFKSRTDFRRRVERGVRGNFWAQKMWAELYESPNLNAFLGHINAVTDHHLRDYWAGYIAARAQSTGILPRPEGVLVSRNRPATQSSTSQWSNHQDPAQDARGACSGQHTGAYNFHTDIEDRAWWSVDLESPHRLTEIRIFNCIANAILASRSNSLGVEVSADGADWSVLYLNDPAAAIGGVDGHPLILKCPSGTTARYVRIFLRARNHLQLDQVEVYAESQT